MQSDRSLTGLRLIPADPNDHVHRILGFVIQIVVKDLLDPSGVSDLCVESGAGVVRYHSVAPAQRVLHGPPWMIAGSRLDVPDIPRVSIESTTLNGPRYRVLVADRATSGVHQPGSLFEVSEELVVDQPEGSLVKWSVDRDDITLGDKFLLDTVSD